MGVVSLGIDPTYGLPVYEVEDQRYDLLGQWLTADLDTTTASGYLKLASNGVGVQRGAELLRRRSPEIRGGRRELAAIDQIGGSYGLPIVSHPRSPPPHVARSSGDVFPGVRGQ